MKFLIDLANFDDILFTTTDAELWTIIEPGLSIIAASIVTLRPLLRAMKITGFSSADTYASGYANRTPLSHSNMNSRPDARGYVRSQELDELPLHGVRTVITRDDGTKGLSQPVITGTGNEGRNGGQSKSSQVLGREDEVSDIGSEDFIIHSHSQGSMTNGGIRRTNTVTISHDKSSDNV